MAEQNDRTTLGTAEWGRGFVEELARETLKEKRAKRRWRIFLWLVFFALVGFSVQRCTEVGGNRMQGGDKQPAQFVATISLDGVISGSEEEGVSASKVNRALRRAFDDPRAVGVILRINSPGGSVTAGLSIYDTMKFIKPDVQTRRWRLRVVITLPRRLTTSMWTRPAWWAPSV